MATINTNTAPYAEIIQFAVSHGYRRSPEALEREGEEGSIGQYGITLDEATTYIRALGLEE